MSLLEGAFLNLLLFSVGGVRFGCDAEQAETVAAYQGQEGDNLFWFHEELEYPSGTVVYHEPSVVTVRTGQSRTYRVVIDLMEDLVEIPTEDIRPLPLLVEPFLLPRGMWGVAERDGRTILLMDFQRFLRDRRGWGAPGMPRRMR